MADKKRVVLGFVLLACLWAIAHANVPIEISGLGWLRDREMRVSLEQLLNSRSASAFDANAVEDAAVIISSGLADEGFQRARIDVSVTLPDGSVRRFPFD